MSVITSTEMIRIKAKSFNENAFDFLGPLSHKESVINRIQAGTIMRIGIATLAMITLPICMNSAGEKSSIERVSVNHVPQNTPVTSIKRKIEIKSIALNFMKTNYCLNQRC